MAQLDIDCAGLYKEQSLFSREGKREGEGGGGGGGGGGREGRDGDRDR